LGPILSPLRTIAAKRLGIDGFWHGIDDRRDLRSVVIAIVPKASIYSVVGILASGCCRAGSSAGAM